MYPPHEMVFVRVEAPASAPASVGDQLSQDAIEISGALVESAAVYQAGDKEMVFVFLKETYPQANWKWEEVNIEFKGWMRLRAMFYDAALEMVRKNKAEWEAMMTQANETTPTTPSEPKIETHLEEIGRTGGRKETVARRLAGLLAQRRNIVAMNKDNSDNVWWYRCNVAIGHIVKNYLPSGSGWDRGTVLEIEDCKEDKLVFVGGYHHMNEGGYYDGWTEHKIIVKPSFIGIDISILGRDRNEIKDYLYQTFDYALGREINELEMLAIHGETIKEGKIVRRNESSSKAMS